MAHIISILLDESMTRLEILTISDENKTNIHQGKCEQQPLNTIYELH